MESNYKKRERLIAEITGYPFDEMAWMTPDQSRALIRSVRGGALPVTVEDRRSMRVTAISLLMAVQTLDETEKEGF